MNLLLDTHIAMWAMSGDPRLPGEAHKLMTQADAHVSVSVVNLWEVAIKHALGRGPGAMPVSAVQLLQDFREAGFPILSVEISHILELERLPLVHADPFDRLLVAQAKAEPLRLLTHDSKLAAYGDAVIVV
ncbi:MAG: type II toxin-antitoxin system VapC family toxin [Caulobacteraceae bacterium]